MQSKHLLNAVVVGVLVFPGCAEYPRHEQQGMVIGGILGGLLGSQVGSGDGRTAAIIVGTMAGSMIGGSVGRSMDDTDRLKAAQKLTGEAETMLVVAAFGRTNRASSGGTPARGTASGSRPKGVSLC